MGKITFMGAGSTVFAKNVLGDCMLTPALRDFELSLYDIDAERLEESYIMIDALNKNINEGRAKITKHLGIPNRKEALRGANFVVDAIQVGGYEPCTVTDFEIPKCTASVRPSRTPSASAVSSAHSVPSPFSKASPKTWTQSARTHGSSTTPTRWRCSPVICSVTRPSRPSVSATAYRSAPAVC